MMRHAEFLVFLIFLWQADRGVICDDRDQCTRNGCFTVIKRAVDFKSAEEYCKDNVFGHLMALKSLTEHSITLDLLRGFSGDYWIGLKLPDGKCPDSTSRLLGYEWTTGGGNNNNNNHNDTEFANWDDTAADHSCSAQKCVSVSAGTGSNSTWRQRPCDGKLQGALCAYSFDDGGGYACDRLPENVDHHVQYMTPRGSAVPVAAGLERFPPGGIAIQKPLGVKHICLGGWVKAPWSCEVQNGGCEEGCESNRCTCPPGQSLRANNVTCGCSPGFVPATDGSKSCVEEVACSERCTGENMGCVNNACVCKDGFEWLDHECVNIDNEICFNCEHQKCEHHNGAWACVCRDRYKVSDADPTKCQMICKEQSCDALDCVSSPDKPGKYTCRCPENYMLTEVIERNKTRVVCVDIDECNDMDGACEEDRQCHNTFGGYTCSCWEGYELQGDKCVSTDDDEGSGTTGPDHQPSIKPTTRSWIPPAALLPDYVKAGSILGILLFVALLMILLYFLVHNALKRCGKVELESLRGADVDIFHLQQVTTEKYKQISFSNQWINDCQRL